MWKTKPKAPETEGPPAWVGELMAAYEGVGKRLELLEKRCSDLEQLPFEKLTARMESVESAFEGIAGDWMNAKGTLQSLYGRITKSTAIAAKAAESGNGALDTAEAVLHFARERGLTR